MCRKFIDAALVSCRGARAIPREDALKNAGQLPITECLIVMDLADIETRVTGVGVQYLVTRREAGSRRRRRAEQRRDGVAGFRPVTKKYPKVGHGVAQCAYFP